MAPPPPARRSRDEILKQLKASRAGGAGGAGSGTGTGTQASMPAPAESTLGTKFKRIGDTKADKKRWVEQDENGRRREILVVTDAQGNTKRKVKWLDKPGGSSGNNSGLLIPNKDAAPLGMDVPAELLSKSTARRQEEEEEDDDIFEGVGADYNPLGDLGEDDDSSAESDEDGEIRPRQPEKAPGLIDGDKERPTQQPSKPRNYFSTSSSTTATATEAAEPPDRSNPLAKDPTILATLKRAAALRAASPSHENDVEGDDEQEREDGGPETSSLRSKKFLEEVRRREMQDAQDMDLGFGESRIEDEEEEEPVVLEGTGAGGSSGSKKRKRGPKKKKGDKDSASDVLRVMEGGRSKRSEF